jgi:phage baseplate assembly protein W
MSQITLLPDIRSKWFSMTLGGQPGEVVQGEDDIAQCMAIILMTRPGEVPHEPEFGCGLWEYIDRPVTEVQGFMSGEAIRAVLRWEPRVERVTGVLFGHSADFSGLIVEFRYIIKELQSERVLQLPLTRAA